MPLRLEMVCFRIQCLMRRFNHPLFLAFVRTVRRAHRFLLLILILADLFFGSLLTGSLVLLGSLDFELIRSYSLFVRVSDNPASSQASQTVLKSLTITVLDENDHAPLFSSANFDRTILDGTAAGTVVVTVHATDGDEPNTPNSHVVYGLTPESGSTFVINRSTGVVSVGNTSIDSDRGPQQYLLHITATDEGTPSLEADPLNDGSNSLPVVISIQDINDNAPAFQNDSSPAWFGPLLRPESTGPGTLIASLAAVDGDVNAALHGSVTYAILPGVSSNLFTLQETAGTVSV